LEPAKGEALSHDPAPDLNKQNKLAKVGGSVIQGREMSGATI
jgi:hypothetical protein